MLEGKRVLVTGGTGSLGQALVRRLLTEEMGMPARITVFSRDEAKQHYMRLEYAKRPAATDEIIYENSKHALDFVIGDVRDYPSIRAAVVQADVIFHAAALKQVPTCEYFPGEAFRTNVGGAENLVRAIGDGGSSVELVVGVSTDKACKPVNVMGMTKALQERVLIEANRRYRETRLVCVRYGNVVASRGSIVPLFVELIASGSPVTITDSEMTRFLITLEQAVDTIFYAAREADPGQTIIPKIPAAKVTDLAAALIRDRDIPIRFTGVRPGEKIHEILVSEEECPRTFSRDDFYVIDPVLPELRTDATGKDFLESEYTSAAISLEVAGLESLLGPYLEAHLAKGDS